MSNTFTKLKDAVFGLWKKEDRDKIADILNTNPELLKKFDNNYKDMMLKESVKSDNLFELSSKDMSEQIRNKDIDIDEEETEYIVDTIKKIVDELSAETRTISIDNDAYEDWKALPSNQGLLTKIENSDLSIIKESLRPQLTGSLMLIDIDVPSYRMVIEQYYKALNSSSEKERALYYNMFRQGLDILDLDPILYEMLSLNRNAMSYWLPAISRANKQQGFFKIPRTIIARVPMPILQLSRISYGSLTPSTLKIVDDWAMRVFELDKDRSYFIKTGTYSSKFDFRNCKVTGEKEVSELGEYLLFIQHQACEAAGPLTKPCPIIGMSTTNEWVVREYIEDIEGNPTIYKGLPLHTEYRIFVDFDTDEILGYTPYWSPEVMKKHFESKANESIDSAHDYVVFKAYEDKLMQRYNDNIDRVIDKIAELIKMVSLDGQWSIDIMQNGNDFWIIDMATADASALKECVPSGLIKKQPDIWLPKPEIINRLLGIGEKE